MNSEYSFGVFAKRPELIGLGEVVRTTEPDLDIADCVGNEE
jgi:DNA-binding IscR family transcriptional regulator